MGHLSPLCGSQGGGQASECGESACFGDAFSSNANNFSNWKVELAFMDFHNICILDVVITVSLAVVIDLLFLHFL